MNIYQKLVEVRKAVSYLKKEASGYQFKYNPSSQVLMSVKEKMDELELLLIPKIVDKRLHTETVEYEEKGKPKKVTTYFTELDMTMTWINAENPEEQIECPWYGQGVDTAGEKGVGKALTYAEKYFILKFFNIATDKDDPDKICNDKGPDKKANNQSNNVQEVKIEEKHIKAIYAVCKAKGVTEEQVNKSIKKDYKKESKKDLNMKEFRHLMDRLNKLSDANQKGA